MARLQPFKNLFFLLNVMSSKISVSLILKQSEAEALGLALSMLAEGSPLPRVGARR